MQLQFKSVEEALPGPKWQALFKKDWHAYRTWYRRRRGHHGAETSLEVCCRRLQEHMPEFVPTWERLVELAGGSDTAARFLTFWRPPAYLIHCSQAVGFSDGEPFLIRNYDLDPRLNEGTILCSAWNGRRVIATNECLAGVADGMNDAGLALSLTYGGRRAVGEGFGIPLILRYILEFCETTAEAVRVLQRVPSHMSYNVTLLDRQGEVRTVLVAPDRETQVTQSPLTTNHQDVPECMMRARFSQTLERERHLQELLADPQLTRESMIAAFLKKPLFVTNYAGGFGTIYTAVYRPASGRADWHWPGKHMAQSFAAFREEERLIRYRHAPAPHHHPAPAWTGHASHGGSHDAPAEAEMSGQDRDALRRTLGGAGGFMPAGFAAALLDALERPQTADWSRLGAFWAAPHMPADAEEPRTVPNPPRVSEPWAAAGVPPPNRFIA